jgi:histidinol-phosphate aminotransferase
MAGLRAGVLAGSAAQIEFVRRVASPYNVNAAALACLPEAIADQEYVRAYVAAVRRGRARLESELRSLGIRYWPSQANFVLAHLGQRREAFIAGMKRRGILVRDRHSDPGCEGCVRMTLGTEEHTSALISAVRECVQEIGRAREVTA